MQALVWKNVVLTFTTCVVGRAWNNGSNQGRSLGITVRLGDVSLFCPTKKAWRKSCPTDISGAN